ncbi:hypothetical protein GCM10009193_14370 [Shewanella aestuarii]|nr:hypothetical protein GCM10009193_14370 [Shewanella aestuarii]
MTDKSTASKTLHKKETAIATNTITNKVNINVSKNFLVSGIIAREDIIILSNSDILAKT